MADQLLQFEPGLMIWTIVVFLLTLVVLSKIAWNPLLKALDERENRIEDALTKSEKAQKEAEQAIAEARADRAAALRKSEEMVQQARADGEKLRQKLLDEAKAESKKVVEQGLERIEAEQRIAMEEIRKTSADLAIEAAKQLIRVSMDESRQREIVEDFLRRTPEARVQ